MCAVSFVSDYYTKQWPQQHPTSPAPWQSDPTVAAQLLEVLRRLDAIDKRLGDIECKDATKAAFIRALEAAAQGLKDSDALASRPVFGA